MWICMFVTSFQFQFDSIIYKLYTEDKYQCPDKIKGICTKISTQNLNSLSKPTSELGVFHDDDDED